MKTRSKETRLFSMLRKLYYRVLRKLSEVPLVENFTGCGLYDQQVVEILRKIDDPYPYFRGLIADIGFECRKDRVPTASTQAGHHQEQSLYALRYGHGGLHQQY